MSTERNNPYDPTIRRPSRDSRFDKLPAQQQGGDPKSKHFDKYGPKAVEELFRRNLLQTNSANAEIKVNFKELSNIQIYDTIVETFLFDAVIDCDNRSKIHKGVSDQMADTVSRFILTSYAKNVHGVNWNVSAEWSLNQCRDYYIHHKGWMTPVDDFMDGRTVYDNFETSLAKVSIRRWELQKSFTDYKTRVFMSLEDWASRRERKIVDLVKEIQVAREIQAKLEEDKETISKMNTVSPAMRTLVNRINPDLTTLLKLSQQEE